MPINWASDLVKNALGKIHTVPPNFVGPTGGSTSLGKDARRRPPIGGTSDQPGGGPIIRSCIAAGRPGGTTMAAGVAGVTGWDHHDQVQRLGDRRDGR